MWLLFALWLIPHFIDLRCVPASQCSMDDIFVLDRFSVLYGDRKADLTSHWVQNSSGIFVILCLISIHFFKRTLPFLFRDLLLLIQAIVWNGAINSVIRFIVARPRPFVFREPEAYGPDAGVYTSFYSGHTSFVALSLTMLVLFLEYYKLPRRTIYLISSVSMMVILFIGILRVQAGVHFLTDIIVGAIAGVLISYGIFRVHQK